jgi:hypothetical protein
MVYNERTNKGDTMKNPVLKTYSDGSEFTAAHMAGAYALGLALLGVGAGVYIGVDKLKFRFRKQKALNVLNGN